ncbi:MAG: hypothetical protein WBW73_21515, partial [Rhodoplanes sp.]
TATPLTVKHFIFLKDVVLIGVLGRAYNWVQWYCTKPILKNSPYNQEHPFVPYIGTWTDIDQSRGGGFCTQYRNLVYRPPDDKQIKDKDPQTNPDAFGRVLIPEQHRE